MSLPSPDIRILAEFSAQILSKSSVEWGKVDPIASCLRILTHSYGHNVSSFLVNTYSDEITARRAWAAQGGAKGIADMVCSSLQLVAKPTYLNKLGDLALVSPMRFGDSEELDVFSLGIVLFSNKVLVCPMSGPQLINLDPERHELFGSI